MTMTTEHKGFEIKFDEQDETWDCHALELSDYLSLKSIKAKIDDMMKKDRHLNVQAFWIKGGHGFTNATADNERVTVKMFCAPERNYSVRGKDVPDSIQRAWVVDANGERYKVKFDDLTPMTEEQALSVWRALCAEAEEASDKAYAALKAVTRFNVDSLSLAAKEAKAVDKVKS